MRGFLHGEIFVCWPINVIFAKAMIGKYKVVTLCGSTRFKEAFERENRRLTLEGYIVLAPGVFGHAEGSGPLSDEEKRMLDNMHLRKIDLSDEVFVINFGGYIGESTRAEIEYAKKHGRIIKYLESPR